MKFTKHATKQAQRRGIREDLVDFVVGHGKEIKARSGARMYRVRRADLEFLRHECPPILWKRYRDQLRRVTPIVAPDQSIITAMHRYRPMWKDLKR